MFSPNSQMKGWESTEEWPRKIWFKLLDLQQPGLQFFGHSRIFPLWAWGLHFRFASQAATHSKFHKWKAASARASHESEIDQRRLECIDKETSWIRKDSLSTYEGRGRRRNTSSWHTHVSRRPRRCQILLASSCGAKSQRTLWQTSFFYVTERWFQQL